MGTNDTIQHDELEEYSRFISDVLRPQLNAARASLDAVLTEIAEYNHLLHQLEEICEQHTARHEKSVDLARQTIYCNAVADADTIFLCMGMGFHIELTIPEAISCTQARLDFLQTHRRTQKELKFQEVSEHIEAASAIMKELGRGIQG